MTKRQRDPRPIHADPVKEPFLRSMLGAAILLGLLAAAEPLLFGRGYYDGLSIHPFWIVVLLAAVQHGLVVGLCTVALATVLVGWPARSVGESATLYFARAAILPLQWLAVALIVGFYRQTQLRETQALYDENARLRRMNDMLAGEVERMDTMVEVLERDAAARPALPIDPPAESRPEREALFRNALPQVAALAGARGDELPEAFSQAADALVDIPVALVVDDPSESPFILGHSEPFGIGEAACRVARSLFDIAGLDHSRVLSASGTDVFHDGALVIRAFRQEVESGLRTAVVAFASNDAEAEDNTGRVDMLAEMARVSIDRLSRDIGADVA